MIEHVVEYITVENVSFILSILIFINIILHRPWMPKTSKHPLIELDKELQEITMLEEMWKQQGKEEVK